MASTKARVHVTSSAWVSVVAGPISNGTISPETHRIRLSIGTAGSPANLKQGHIANPSEGWNFVLDTGETLYAIADSTETSYIVTY